MFSKIKYSEKEHGSEQKEARLTAKRTLNLLLFTLANWDISGKANLTLPSSHSGHLEQRSKNSVVWIIYPNILRKVSNFMINIRKKRRILSWPTATG